MGSEMFEELTIDLQRPPGSRWRLTPTQKEQGRQLLKSYTADLGLRTDAVELLISVAKNVVRSDHWEEMESLAREVAVPVREVVLCNLYYDALKAALDRVFGCTAFAIDIPGGVLHARNLDWWTENSALARHTTINHFVGGPAGKFTTISWPGFVGALSGIAPGRFAVTLNAVLSVEAGQLAMPVVFLLRTVLEEARTFEEARDVLCSSPIPCDCLLLLTGTHPGELVVIERTPSRHAIRGPQHGYVCVTNGYQQLDAALGSAPSDLLATCCQRFDRIEALISAARPRDAEGCLRYLSDPEVQMGITVQQMVFRAATGEYWVRLPQPTQAT
jgi:hypothetical protein